MRGLRYAGSTLPGASIRHCLTGLALPRTIHPLSPRVCVGLLENAGKEPAVTGPALQEARVGGRLAEDEPEGKSR